MKICYNVFPTKSEKEQSQKDKKERERERKLWWLYCLIELEFIALLKSINYCLLAGWKVESFNFHSTIIQKHNNRKMLQKKKKIGNSILNYEVKHWHKLDDSWDLFCYQNP